MTSTSKVSSEATQDKQDPPRGNNTTTAYIIAGITLGAAVGNMFLAGRIRNVMKINIPRSDAWRGGGSTSSTHSSSSAGSSAHTRSSRSDGSHTSSGNNRTEQLKSAATQDYSLPFAIRGHLKVLGMPQEATDEKRIKDAYRAVVMKYHPDRIPIHTSRDNNGVKDDDSHALRLQYESKFKEVTDSYNSLIAYFAKG